MKLTVVLTVLIGTLALACSSVTPVPAEPTPNIDATAVLEPTPDIDATVEARLAQERAIEATVEARLAQESAIEAPDESIPTLRVSPLPTLLPKKPSMLTVVPTPIPVPIPAPTNPIPLDATDLRTATPYPPPSLTPTLTPLASLLQTLNISGLDGYVLIVNEKRFPVNSTCMDVTGGEICVHPMSLADGSFKKQSKLTLAAFAHKGDHRVQWDGVDSFADTIGTIRMTQHSVVSMEFIPLEIESAVVLPLVNKSAHVFAGSAILDEYLVPDGTVISAWIEGEQKDADVASNGKYSLSVEAIVGSSIVFQIGSWVAWEDAGVELDGVDILDLHASSEGIAGPIPNLPWSNPIPTPFPTPTLIPITIPVPNYSSSVDTGGSSVYDPITASLSIDPEIAVPGQEVTLNGGGFTQNDNLSTVFVGGQTITYISSGGFNTSRIISSGINISSSGNFSITFLIPDSIATRSFGDHKVTATDGAGVAGQVSLRTPGKTLTLSTDTSNRGSYVTVTGTGYEANETVSLTYSSGSTVTTLGSATTDSHGEFTKVVTIPNTPSTPSTNTITGAISSGGSKTVTHKVGASAITTDVSEASTGESVTITGTGFPNYATVATMTIGGLDVRPTPAPSTDVDGGFSSTVMVPGLTEGNHTVKVTASSVTGSISLTVTGG